MPQFCVEVADHESGKTHKLLIEASDGDSAAQRAADDGWLVGRVTDAPLQAAANDPVDQMILARNDKRRRKGRFGKAKWVAGGLVVLYVIAEVVLRSIGTSKTDPAAILHASRDPVISETFDEFVNQTSYSIELHPSVTGGLGRLDRFSIYLFRDEVPGRGVPRDCHSSQPVPTWYSATFGAVSTDGHHQGAMVLLIDGRRATSAQGYPEGVARITLHDMVTLPNAKEVRGKWIDGPSMQTVEFVLSDLEKRKLSEYAARFVRTP